ncbi:MAG: HEAT repeat domain-containing protein [Gemmatimonadaceae bacterium]
MTRTNPEQRTSHMVKCRWLVVLLHVSAGAVTAQQPARPVLSARDIDDITQLVMMEDRRDFDIGALTRLLASTHPEVRRRAVLTVGRIADPRGRPLARAAASDRDSAIAATAVFAVGQLKDTAAVPWLDSVLHATTSPVTVAREAAAALGKIKTSDARTILAHFLQTAPNARRMASVVGEALLSIGRIPVRGDLAPIVRWATSPDVNVRWRASWALFRPRDPNAVPHLMRLTRDPSPLVRAWAVRGLNSARVDSSGITREQAATVLRTAVRDPDRTVRTEAVRALGTYADSASFDVLTHVLGARDTWLSVSAAEGLGRMTDRAADAVQHLTQAAAAGQPRALRITAMQSLLALSPTAALAPAEAMARDSSATSRLAALGVFRRLGKEHAQAVGSLADDADVEVRSEARRVRDIFAGDSLSPHVSASSERPIDTGRSESDYRRLVERWVVPSYMGQAPAPVSRWQTSRGTIDIELFPGDAPLAVDDFVRSVESGALAGVEFERVVPNFVDQQRAIRQTGIIRDEVNRHGLTRGNLSWASGGLDTGIPGYTFGVTPQPHNEGDFTSLGRVVRGMEVVDRIELGDRVRSVTMIGTRPAVGSTESRSCVESGTEGMACYGALRAGSGGALGAGSGGALGACSKGVLWGRALRACSKGVL